MVLTTAQAVPIENKENVVFKPTKLFSRHANGRRPRSRLNKTPSPVYLTREAARDPVRRRARSSSVIATIRVVEDADTEMSDSTTATEATVPQQRIELPRHLKRPAFRAIDPSAIEAVDPELSDVPIEYIHQVLKAAGPQMLCVAANTRADPPRRCLPHELEVIINDTSAEPPTHLFAVYSKRSARVALHPAHALILAANCAHLPTLPHSKSSNPTSAGCAITLPVVPLCLPSPATFPILLHYLYTKRAEHLLSSLLPMPPQDCMQWSQQFSQRMATTFTQAALFSHTWKVHGLWSNVAALGIFDETLWRTIETMWSVLLDALAISTGATWKTAKQVTQQS